MNEKYWGEKKPPAKKDAQSTPPDKHIVVHENKIYYYANVNRDSAVELNKKVGELESKSLTMSKTLDIDTPSIKVLINSGGGSITAGISSMDTILRCKVPVETYVDGFCASAATFLSVVKSFTPTPPTKAFLMFNSICITIRTINIPFSIYIEFFSSIFGCPFDIIHSDIIINWNPITT